MTPNDHRLWRNLGAALHWAPGERHKASGRLREGHRAGRRGPQGESEGNATLLGELADAYSMVGRRGDARERRRRCESG